MYKNKIVGKYGEDAACKYLKKLGYLIIERNFLCKSGEIDIIAQDENELVFIEVKLRTSYIYGRGLEAIDNRKIKKMKKSALYYIYVNKKEKAFIRFDAIEICLGNSKIELKHYKNII